MERSQTPFYSRLMYILVSLIALGYLAIIGKEIISPLMFAFLFAILLIPVADFFERKWKFSRAISSLASILVLMIIVGLILYFLGSQLSNLVNDWPVLQKQVGKAISELHIWVERTFKINADKQMSYIDEGTSKMLSSTVSVVGVTLLTVSSTFLFYAFVLLFTFFMLLNRRLLFSFIVGVFHSQHKETIHEISEQIKYIIKRYILGLFLQMCVIAIITCTVLAILGVKYAILLGLVTAIFNIVPYIGIFTALLISVLITFATVSAGKALIVAIAMVCIHALDGNVLMPLIVGSKVKLNALIVMLGIVVGEMMWGIPGMFLCIPYIAIMKVIFDRIDTLKPWGMLLGDEEPADKPVKKMRKKLDLEVFGKSS
ncbi:AI-2E family transporter [Pedobacter sp. HMF7647]|uniref:AI-2E family transporter n=1 Tax=Hufsiella arboris TaxID=2695275 RepID=A0A7K1Y7B4_9SPHI|nr:AI-2E family transporter [Hufsiella arboris]MXV50462.1 AI-2E family transporter [Hufsiella arboris]